MFTGIITEIGKVLSIKESDQVTTFTIETKEILNNKKIGESIAVNGACVTITTIKKNTFNFDAINETLKLTNLSELKENDQINLEPALRPYQSLDGHMVQGHIDTLGEVFLFEKSKKRNRLTIKYKKNISNYLAFKGSITVNGVSMTISDLKAEHFSVDLTPHTLENTNLSQLKKGNKVNLEIDIIARYLEKMLKGKEKEAKFDFLKERGFI